MDITGFLTDDDAASSVIGVILMVAVAVILAAVIGQFVLGLSDKVNNSAPQAKFDFTTKYVQKSDALGRTSNLTRVTIVHSQGDKISGSGLQVRVDGDTAFDITNVTGGTGSRLYVEPIVNDTASFTAGDEITITMTYSGDLELNQSQIVGFPGGSGDPSITGYDNDGRPNTPGDFEPLSGQDTPTRRIQSGDTVAIYWTDPGSDDSAKLAEYDVP